ncbi:MAG: alanine racemase [Brevinematia bacterium]
MTYAEISLSTIWHNYLELRKLNLNKPIIPVIKADSYGHGATRIMEFLFLKGVRRFAVAKIEEVFSLKEELLSRGNKSIFEESEILIFCPIPFRYLGVLLDDLNLIPIVSDVSFIRELEKLSRSAGRRLKFGIEIDTGMGRLGIHHRESNVLLDILWEVKNLDLVDIMTHFPSSDFDREFSLYQIEIFDRILDKVKIIFPDVKSHVSNSGGVLNIPEGSKYDFARCGLSVYGYYPNMALVGKADIRNSLALKSYVALRKFFRKGESISYNRTYFMDRDGYIAVVPCGYADGIPTLYSNNMEVVIRGRRYSVVGRVTMDYIMVRVDEVVGPGDEVVIFGGCGYGSMRVEEFASRVGLIPYEITCGISKRVPRVYLNNDSSAPEMVT